MRVSYTPRYYADIGEGHVFPIRKFELVRDRLLREGTLAPSEIVEPREAAVEDALLVHTEDYLTRLRARDRAVLTECRARGVPVATVMSGGYAADVNDTVEIHCNTIRAAKHVFGGVQSFRAR